MYILNTVYFKILSLLFMFCFVTMCAYFKEDTESLQAPPYFPPDPPENPEHFGLFLEGDWQFIQDGNKLRLFFPEKFTQIQALLDRGWFFQVTNNTFTVAEDGVSVSFSPVLRTENGFVYSVKFGLNLQDKRFIVLNFHPVFSTLVLSSEYYNTIEEAQFAVPSFLFATKPINHNPFQGIPKEGWPLSGRFLKESIDSVTLNLRRERGIDIQPAGHFLLHNPRADHFVVYTPIAMLGNDYLYSVAVYNSSTIEFFKKFAVLRFHDDGIQRSTQLYDEILEVIPPFTLVRYLGKDVIDPNAPQKKEEDLNKAVRLFTRLDMDSFKDPTDKYPHIGNDNPLPPEVDPQFMYIFKSYGNTDQERWVAEGDQGKLFLVKTKNNFYVPQTKTSGYLYEPIKTVHFNDQFILARNPFRSMGVTICKVSELDLTISTVKRTYFRGIMLYQVDGIKATTELQLYGEELKDPKDFVWRPSSGILKRTRLLSLEKQSVTEKETKDERPTAVKSYNQLQKEKIEAQQEPGDLLYINSRWKVYSSADPSQEANFGKSMTYKLSSTKYIRLLRLTSTQEATLNKGKVFVLKEERENDRLLGSKYYVMKRRGKKLYISNPVPTKEALALVTLQDITEPFAESSAPEFIPRSASPDQ